MLHPFTYICKILDDEPHVIYLYVAIKIVFRKQSYMELSILWMEIIIPWFTFCTSCMFYDYDV